MQSQTEAHLDANTAGIADDFKGFLFRTTRGKGEDLTVNLLAQSNVYRMIRRGVIFPGSKTRMGDHAFRATGTTLHLRNDGRRELAQHMAAHESPRTTALYVWREDEVAVNQVERIIM